MLAYVFWHWKRAEISAQEYSRRQRAFHTTLASSPSAGFLESFSVRISQASWAADGGDAYEDWYLLQDFGALGLLNEAAVSASLTSPHNAAAAGAAGGTGGVYGLRLGAVVRHPKYAQWFGKPDGMSYADLFFQLAPVVDQIQGAIWMRQMVLGPAPEFCLHTATPVSLPAVYSAFVIPLCQAWLKSANHAVERMR